MFDVDEIRRLNKCKNKTEEDRDQKGTVERYQYHSEDYHVMFLIKTLALDFVGRPVSQIISIN